MCFIGIARFLEENEDPVYVLTIGEYDNKNTTLRNSIDSAQPFLVVPSEGILSCDEASYFWIQWVDRFISKFLAHLVYQPKGLCIQLCFVCCPCRCCCCCLCKSS